MLNGKGPSHIPFCSYTCRQVIIMVSYQALQSFSCLIALIVRRTPSSTRAIRKEKIRSTSRPRKSSGKPDSRTSPWCEKDEGDLSLEPTAQAKKAEDRLTARTRFSWRPKVSLHSWRGVAIWNNCMQFRGCVSRHLEIVAPPHLSVTTLSRRV